MRDDYKERVRKRIELVRKGNTTDLDWQAPCVTGDGREVWVETRRSVIEWASKPAILVTVRDITARKLRELEMEEKRARLEQENIALKSTIKDRYRFGEIIGKSPAMQNIYKLIASASASDAHVTISGESGTGARIVTGGQRLERPGYFYPPTIVTDIAEGIRLVDEEQFGPALPIMPFCDIDEALERANATHFGLAGSIWTNDLELGAELASQLECGSGGVNQHGYFTLSAPFGGMKWSGIGRQNGVWGLEEFTDLQVVHIDRA